RTTSLNVTRVPGAAVARDAVSETTPMSAVGGDVCAAAGTAKMTTAAIAVMTNGPLPRSALRVSAIAVIRGSSWYWCTSSAHVLIDTSRRRDASPDVLHGRTHVR